MSCVVNVMLCQTCSTNSVCLSFDTDSYDVVVVHPRVHFNEFLWSVNVVRTVRKGLNTESVYSVSSF